ncbi:DUF6326 family protein [Bacillus spongiae]|uniref:DUF6326 family protein n=1 Tax=Bacillus spongiae TaxID=2683610 RepID=A0ABU8HK00_9BACI
MNSEHKIFDLERKATLSTLWIFVLLNLIFRDLHELFRPELLGEMMTGIVNGTVITEGLLLGFGMLLEIPIAMVLLSRVLSYSLNRWANIIAGIVTLVIFVVFGGVNDLDDMFFLTVEVAALIVIIVYAWKWPKHVS